MKHINKNHYQAGVAHLAIVIALVVVIAGALGFVAYSRMQGQVTNAGGFGILGFGKIAPPKTPDNNTGSNASGNTKAPNNSKKNVPELLKPVTVTFTPSDWKLSKYAKVVKDPKYGTILQINKVGMAADAEPLATLSPDNEKFAQLTEFNKASIENLTKYMTNYKKNHYVGKFCVSSQQLYRNQDWSKHPYVSTYQTRIAGLGQANGFAISGMHNDPAWHANECKTEDMKGTMHSLSAVLQGKYPVDYMYNQYTDGLKITTKTYGPESGIKAADGTIKIGNVSITYTYDY